MFTVYITEMFGTLTIIALFQTIERAILPVVVVVAGPLVSFMCDVL